MCEPQRNRFGLEVRERMDYVRVYWKLRPSPKFKGSLNTREWVWKDERPEPTYEESWACWVEMEELRIRKEKEWDAEEAFLAKEAAGFFHTNGVKYYCDDKAITDYVKIIILMNLELNEPVYIRNFQGTPTEMSFDDFKIFAIAVGKHAYNLRKEYWLSLM